jgi:hypothetical protein
MIAIVGSLVMASFAGALFLATISLGRRPPPTETSPSARRFG